MRTGRIGSIHLQVVRENRFVSSDLSLDEQIDQIKGGKSGPINESEDPDVIARLSGLARAAERKQGCKFFHRRRRLIES